MHALSAAGPPYPLTANGGMSYRRTGITHYVRRGFTMTQQETKQVAAVPEKSFAKKYGMIFATIILLAVLIS